jgi:hypothetical protein
MRVLITVDKYVLEAAILLDVSYMFFVFDYNLLSWAFRVEDTFSTLNLFSGVNFLSSMSMREISPTKL